MTESRTTARPAAPTPAGPSASAGSPTESAPVLETRGLSVRTRGRTLLAPTDLRVAPGTIHGIIGPSGAGKSTLLRCLNRLVELDSELVVSGEVLYRGRPVTSLPADDLRARVGMIFQQPLVFPGSIEKNVVFAARHFPHVHRRDLPELTESALREAALWDEVKDRLREPASKLSVGQRQRLALARCLAGKPEVLLLDEPTSALDPRSTRAIEELLRRLSEHHTILIVTHDLGQARRVADRLSCLCIEDGAGALLETACCAELLENPRCQAVADFLRQAR